MNNYTEYGFSSEAIQVLEMMFKPYEKVCLSPNEFAYDAIDFTEIYRESVNLVSKDGRARSFDCEKLKMIALNPSAKGRRDSDCTAFRNFLIEFDDGSIEEQRDYATSIGLPYSAIIFSGNKSLHYLLTLEIDLPDIETYRFIARWILAIASRADQNTKNPSRSLRIPGALRDTGKLQELLVITAPVPNQLLVDWVAKHPHFKPTEYKATEAHSDTKVPSELPDWVIRELSEGIRTDKGGRNTRWFQMSCECSKTGLSLTETLEVLENFFSPTHDFLRSEWMGAIKSGYKYDQERRLKC